MNILIATDIHGINDRLRAMLHTLGDDITFLSPWPGEGSPYKEEQEAVAAFQANHGMEHYQQRIATAAGDAPAIFIGFSVGATALWLHTASPLCHPHSHAHLYYGSRIRDHQERIPRCQTKLVFAEQEASFQPASILAKLTHPHVQCSIIEGTRHGFMNPLAPNFSDAHMRHEIGKLKAFIQSAGKEY